ncbi:hypothetical protein [Clostridium sp. HBUAS56010]|uniref:hypothetical protein n=1 Tax=Clostridium sp. HBUAS56010 TaxID=2571127 RepID=UPI0011775DB1|nr:hypothetical protein [Clostridium sp. HBUAS56010]
MESFIPVFLLIIVFLLICLICIALLIFIIKVKKGWLWLLSIILIVAAGINIHDRAINSVFYDFKTEMCKVYPEINDIKLQIVAGGTTCTIYVDMEKEIEEKEVENIFIDMLKRFNQEPMSDYLKGNSNPKNKRWGVLQVLFFGTKQGSFYSERYIHSEWFTKENQKEQIWKNRYTKKIYNYSDYME